MSILSISDTQVAETTWTWNFVCDDEDTGEAIDFTGASITINIRDFEGCLRVSCTVGSGITIVDVGVIQLKVSADQSNLCAGTYLMNGKYTLNGETLPLFSGTVSVERP